MGLVLQGIFCMQVEEDSSTTSRNKSRTEVSNQRKHCSRTSFEDMTTIHRGIVQSKLRGRDSQRRYMFE